jgi:serine/threonine-protein kinase HipA
MICGDQRRFANAANIRSQHARFRLDREDAEKIIFEMKQQVENAW